MVKWVSTEHNRGLREVLDHVVQLQGLWTELQTQFLSKIILPFLSVVLMLKI